MTEKLIEDERIAINTRITSTHNTKRNDIFVNINSTIPQDKIEKIFKDLNLTDIKINAAKDYQGLVSIDDGKTANETLNELINKLQHKIKNSYNLGLDKAFFKDFTDLHNIDNFVVTKHSNENGEGYWVVLEGDYNFSFLIKETSEWYSAGGEHGFEETNPKIKPFISYSDCESTVEDELEDNKEVYSKLREKYSDDEIIQGLSNIYQSIDSIKKADTQDKNNNTSRTPN